MVIYWSLAVIINNVTIVGTPLLRQQAVVGHTLVYAIITGDGTAVVTHHQAIGIMVAWHASTYVHYITVDILHMFQYE